MNWPMQSGLCKSDNFNRMITLSVITISGGHCITITYLLYNNTIGTILSMDVKIVQYITK